MAKKKELKVEEFAVEIPVTAESPVKSKPSKIEFNFGNGDLNVLKDKLNEVIDSL